MDHDCMSILQESFGSRGESVILSGFRFPSLLLHTTRYHEFPPSMSGCRKDGCCGFATFNSVRRFVTCLSRPGSIFGMTKRNRTRSPSPEQRKLFLAEECLSIRSKRSVRLRSNRMIDTRSGRQQQMMSIPDVLGRSKGGKPISSR